MVCPALHLHCCHHFLQMLREKRVFLLLPQLPGVASGKGAGWALQHLTQLQLFEPEARMQPSDTSFLSFSS